MLSNVRATKRLQKEVIKIKEVLSANNQAFVKIPELLDYVTLRSPSSDRSSRRLPLTSSPEWLLLRRKL